MNPFLKGKVVTICGLPLETIGSWSPVEQVYYGNDYTKDQIEADEKKYALVKKVAKEFKPLSEIQALKLINVHETAAGLEDAKDLLTQDEWDTPSYADVAAFIERNTEPPKLRSLEKEMENITFFINRRLVWSLLDREAFKEAFGLGFESNEWTVAHSIVFERFIPQIETFRVNEANKNEAVGSEEIEINRSSKSKTADEKLGENTVASAA